MHDENTPLLGLEAPTSTDLHVPCINTALRRVAALDVNQIRFSDVVNDELHQFKDQPTLEVAFALTVLLYLRRTKTDPCTSNDVYERWLVHKANARDVEILENLATEIWALFLAEYRSVLDLQAVLWTSFPLEDDSERTFRVVDLLSKSDPPASLLSHPLILEGIEHTWINGLGYENSFSAGFLARYDALSTPRVMHHIDWAAHAAFLALLAHFLLYPIEQTCTSTDWLQCHYGPREVSLILLALSFIMQPISLANTSALLVPLAFMASLPSTPDPNHLSFNLLQWAAFLQPLGLNLPQAPSHLFFVKPSFSLPLAVAVYQGLSRILYPVMLLFLPLLLLASYLLSLSLADSFLQLPTAHLLLQVAPPPLTTRFTFLCFFATVFVLFFSSVFVLAVSKPKNSHSTGGPHEFRAPAKAAEVLGAQRVMAGIVASYSAPYFFPPPFNIVHVLIIWAPRRIVGILGLQTSPALIGLERVVWRIVVGPFAALVSSFLWRPRRLS